jgi:hypothetical protein
MKQIVPMILRERQYEQCLGPNELGQFTVEHIPAIILAAERHCLTIPQFWRMPYTVDSLSLATQF